MKEYGKKKRKPKPPVKLFSVLDIPKGDFDIPTNLSSNRYVPYGTSKHRGKRYIYIEGVTDDEKYIGDITSSDITSSSESEYEEIDMHIPHSPKYKTLIEVVLEPSKRDIQNDMPSDDIPTNKPMNDEEWNELKDDFISQYLQNEPRDMPNILDDNVDNNTHPSPTHHNMDQKPFIMSIHDRNLYTGEEYNYDMLNSGIYGSSSNPDPISDNPSSYSGTKDPFSGNVGSNSDNHNPISDNPSSYSDNPHPYSGIDLINDSLSGNHDIYDEILKRKENELFGTENTKKPSTYSVAKHTNTDPIINQIQLFHKWLDRHRDMCQQWNKNNSKEEMLDMLKEEWENESSTSGKLSDIPSSKQILNTDVSIQIDMDNPKTINAFSNMDTYPDISTMDNMLDDINKKFNEPNYYDIYEDDIYYDVNDAHNTSIGNPKDMEKPSKVQIELDVRNGQMVKEKYPISDIWGI
nr:erythrocyte membrane protein 1, PfEMP1, putative [Plasmodium sp. DRC-Itaito]